MTEAPHPHALPSVAVDPTDGVDGSEAVRFEHFFRDAEAAASRHALDEKLRSSRQMPGPSVRPWSPGSGGWNRLERVRC